MKAIHQIGLGLIMLVAAGAASAGNHGPNKGHGYKPGSYPHQQYTECKVTRQVTHNGKRYKEETVCKAPAKIHARHAPPPKHVHYAPPPPPRPVHVVHMPPPPPAVVIGPQGVRVNGVIQIGW